MPEPKHGWAAVFGGPRDWSPAFFFIYDLLILTALLLLGPFHPASIHTSGWLTDPFPNVLPGIVPWAGAVGGVCISLVGVAGHAKDGDWHPEIYGYWHLTRAALGALFGSVAVLAVTLLLKNVTAAGSGSDLTDSGTAVLAVISFVVGFREETFRSLILRVADVILGPSANPTTSQYALVPSPVVLASTAVGSTSQGTVHFFNASAADFTLASNAITITGDGLTATLPSDPVTVASGGSAAITLTWTPANAGPLAATMSVAVAGGVVTASIIGSTS